MGGGMAFLMLKGFHPSNHTNQRRIWLAEQAAKDKEERDKEQLAEFQAEQEKLANRRLADGGSDKSHPLDFMYAAPPGLKEKQEQEEAEAARKQQLENLGGIGDQQDKFLQHIQNAPREGHYVDTNEVHVQPFGVDQSVVRAAQRANQRLQRGQMAGEDNPFVSHRSTALDNLKLKNQEWSVGHDFVVDEADKQEETDEASLLASLSHKDRKLLAKYTKKLLKPSHSGDLQGAVHKKKHKKEKKKKHKEEKKHKNKHKHKRHRDNSSSS